jgi:glucose-1-phosphate adenylyltransferase
MARSRPLVIILAGGAGGRLDLLTRSRAKPAVPFAGTHRLIDFPLSNAHNAGLTDVWISQQFNPISLSDHLANGRPWDLDRNDGGMLSLVPRLGNDDRTGFQQGTADGLWRYAPLMRDFAADAIVVASADAPYRLDYESLVAEHTESGAEVTMVTYEVDPGDAGRYGVVQTEGGRVREYVYKPDEPQGNVVANEVFVFRPAALLDTLDELGAEAGEEGLKDLGHDLLPRLVDAGGAREHRFEGFWRDVGTIASYWTTHQELVDAEPPITLDDPEWPILTHAMAHRASARIGRTAEIRESLVAPGAHVAGSVERSVIGRGAVIEEGAVLRGAVVLPGAVVRAGARVEDAIVDDRVEIGRDAVVGASGGDPALVGLAARVPDGATIPAGARFPDDEE